MRDDTARRGQLALRYVPLLGGRRQHQKPAPRSDDTMVLVVGGDCPAATLDLRAVLRIEVGLLDLDLRPVDVELVGDDHWQRGLDTLSGLRILRDDRECVVGVDRDVGVWRERGRGTTRTSTPPLRQHVRGVKAYEQAAAGHR